MNHPTRTADELRMAGIDPDTLDTSDITNVALFTHARDSARLRAKPDRQPQLHNARCRLAEAALAWRTRHDRPHAGFPEDAWLRATLDETAAVPAGALRVALRHHPTGHTPQSYATPQDEDDLGALLTSMLRRLLDPADRTVPDTAQAARRLVDSIVSHARIKSLLWLLPDTRTLTATTDPDEDRADTYLVTPDDTADTVLRRMAVAAVHTTLLRMADQVLAEVADQRARHEAGA